MPHAGGRPRKDFWKPDPETGKVHYRVKRSVRRWIKDLRSPVFLIRRRAARKLYCRAIKMMRNKRLTTVNPDQVKDVCKALKQLGSYTLPLRPFLYGRRTDSHA